MLKNPDVQIFGAIGANSDIWQHIATFAWWHVQVIFNSSSIKLWYKNLNCIFFTLSRYFEKGSLQYHLAYFINSYNWFLYFGTRNCCIKLLLEYMLLSGLPLKVTCTCHRAKIIICCQTQLVAPIAPKICVGGSLNMLNPNLASDLLSGHSRNTIQYYLCASLTGIVSKYKCLTLRTAFGHLTDLA